MKHSLVTTTTGRIEGFVEGSLSKFFGIPYAAPPVGPLRWHAPMPQNGWEVVRPAKNFGSACVQTVGASFGLRAAQKSEDCLYLNVWTRTTDTSAGQPVMVWIHGGGNLGGGGCEDAYDGSSLAAKGVTVVTFNYRLGAFGFLVHPDVGGNFGVLDQVAALAWVRDNIAAFGGAAGNVTVFGESAGAVAVRTLLSCPTARNLFHRAAMQSAGFESPAFAPPWSYGRAQAAAEKLFEALGSKDLNVLRNVPTAEVGRLSHELCGVIPVPGKVTTPANLVWMPVLDEQVVYASGYPGWPDKVPLMMGCTENEARYFIKPGGVYPPQAVVGMASVLCGPKRDDVLAILERDGGTPYESLDKLFTTAIWIEPAAETARKFAELGRSVYCYHFHRRAPGAIASQDLAKHTSEIRYVFGNLTSNGYYDAVDETLSLEMQDAWISFAREGIPRRKDGSAWPVYRDDDRLLSLIDTAIRTRSYELSELARAINSIRVSTAGC